MIRVCESWRYVIRVCESRSYGLEKTGWIQEVCDREQKVCG